MTPDERNALVQKYRAEAERHTLEAEQTDVSTEYRAWKRHEAYISMKLADVWEQDQQPHP